ncbi:MAG TPA: hypothetical protein VH393_00605 [Ktedonobacterales bacterium]|jgi:hypothetical protein
MQSWQGLRRLEAIFGLVAAVAGCAVTLALAAAISSGALPASKPGALFFQVMGFTAFLAVGLGAALHAAEMPASPAGVALLWFGAVIAGLLTMLGALSIGICLLPGTSLAVAAALTALLRIPMQPRPPNPLGWLELLSGVAAPVATLVGLGVLLYWASISYVGPDKGGDFSRADLYGVAPTLPLFVGAILLGLVVAIGAAQHALQRAALGRALLWLAMLLLAAVTAMAFGGVDTVRYLSLAGPYLTPALALASLAALAALASAGRDNTPTVAR